MHEIKRRWQKHMNSQYYREIINYAQKTFTPKQMTVSEREKANVWVTEQYYFRVKQ